MVVAIGNWLCFWYWVGYKQFLFSSTVNFSAHGAFVAVSLFNLTPALGRRPQSYIADPVLSGHRLLGSRFLFVLPSGTPPGCRGWDLF